MNKERLLHLIEVLESNHETTFDMDSWGADLLFRDNERSEVKFDCGFSACALGHAALDPEFISQGLKLDFNDGARGCNGTIVFQDHIDFKAGEIFFDISEEEAIFLFDPSEYMDGYEEDASIQFYLKISEETSFKESSEIKPGHVVERIKWLLR